MFTVKCPDCGVNTNMWLAEKVYQGPFRCWKCKASFLVKIADEELKYCEPISEDKLKEYLNKSQDSR